MKVTIQKSKSNKRIRKDSDLKMGRGNADID